MAFLLYNLALILLLPGIVVFILYRILVSGKSRRAWPQQLGFVSLPHAVRDRPRIWIHAVSVGESVAVAEVITVLKKLVPEAAVVVSTTTQTGQEMARKSLKDADAFIYYPFDLAPCVALALAKVSPVVFASTDTEIWPNFRHIARSKGVRNAIVNGTVSDKTLSGARKVPWIYRWTLGNIDLFCMQSEADAQRIKSMGADPERVVATGNCKADQAECAMTDAEKADVRSWFRFPDDASVFVAGSTNPGEDGPVLDAFVFAREMHPELRLVVAPRQIERRAEIEQLAVERGLSVGHRSEPETVTGEQDVVVLDTFGELAKVYGIADVTFVGGSLIPKGCHSILQPIAQGKPVFFGPYTFKARDLVTQAMHYGAGFEVADGRELGERVAALLDDTSDLVEIKARCERMMEANRGASQLTAELLARLYEKAAGGRGEVERKVS